jgi:Mg2+-importing ATPase
VEKRVDQLAADTPLAQRANLLHLGTHVVSGSGWAVVVHTGRATAYGAIADRLRLRSPETEFERGVRRFGNLLVEVTLILIALIFAFNVLLKRPVVDSFLFALALGVGLTPQLLPAIISVNLAQGARSMARRRVIVKRLAAIENFGSMDVLCSDKTGTLTEGVVRLGQTLAADGLPCPAVLDLARLNALFETGFVNPIDAALREPSDPPPGPIQGQAAPPGGAEQARELPGLPSDPAVWTKLDEKPFDFHRKRQSVLLQPRLAARGAPQLITKGALGRVLEVCTLARRADGSLRPLADLEASIRELAQERARRGERVLGVASRRHPPGDIAFIQRFMLAFGLVSSVFDYLTFAVLLWLLRCDAAHFRTGWFVESVLSAAMVVLVVRPQPSGGKGCLASLEEFSIGSIWAAASEGASCATHGSQARGDGLLSPRSRRCF